MTCDNYNVFMANVNGAITCEIVNSIGEPQDLNNCQVFFNLGNEFSNVPIISLPMDIFDINKCSINLSSSDTQTLDVGEYQFNLIIIDSKGKEHTSEKIRITIDRPIKN